MENVLKKDPKGLAFQVTWIGFWFNIPASRRIHSGGPEFFNTGYDVVISGIDTTEALVVARQKRQEKKQVWAIPYDYKGACEGAMDACVGVPYFNWGPPMFISSRRRWRENSSRSGSGTHRTGRTSTILTPAP